MPFLKKLPSYQSKFHLATAGSSDDKFASKVTPPARKKSKQTTLTQAIYSSQDIGSEKKEGEVGQVKIKTTFDSDLTKLDQGDICVSTAMSLNHDGFLNGPLHPVFLVFCQIEAFERKHEKHKSGVETGGERAKVNMIQVNHVNGRSWYALNAWVPVNEIMKLTHYKDEDLSRLNAFFIDDIEKTSRLMKRPRVG